MRILICEVVIYLKFNRRIIAIPKFHEDWGERSGFAMHRRFFSSKTMKKDEHIIRIFCSFRAAQQDLFRKKYKLSYISKFNILFPIINYNLPFQEKANNSILFDWQPRKMLRLESNLFILFIYLFCLRHKNLPFENHPNSPFNQIRLEMLFSCRSPKNIQKLLFLEKQQQKLYTKRLNMKWIF